MKSRGGGHDAVDAKSLRGQSRSGCKVERGQNR